MSGIGKISKLWGPSVPSKLIGAPSTPKEPKITNKPGRKLTETEIDSG